MVFYPNDGGFGCGDVNNEGLSVKKGELTSNLEIPLDFGRAHLGFLRSSLELLWLEVEDEVGGVGANENLKPWVLLFIGS